MESPVIAGKSTLMKVLCIEWLFEKRRRIAYVCRNYILAKKIYQDLIQYFPQQYLKKANGSDLTIETIFGSTLTFFSAESGASLRGQSFHYLIMDEFSFFPFQQTDGTNLWNDILFPTTKVNGIKTIFVSTPLGKQNLFFEMYQRGLNKAEYPNYHSIKKDIYSDGLITPSDIEDIKKNIPDISFKQEFLCEFLDESGSFFQGYARCFKQFNYNDNIPQYIGIDLSNVGADKTILTKINQNNEVEQYEIAGTLDVKYYKIAKLIDNTPNLKNVIIEANGAGIVQINEIKKLTSKSYLIKEFVTTNSSKLEQASALSLLFAKEEISLKEENIWLFNELSHFGYKFTKTGKMQLMGESNEHDDRVLSLMLAIQAKQDKSKQGAYEIQFNRKIKTNISLAEKYG